MTNGAVINLSPVVSVVITCYNYGKYLEKCLESVFSQTFKDYEIIVIDDGSTDETTAIMSQYALKLNMTYVRQENKGQAVAKNVGILKSRAPYIAFLDADDVWEATKLEKQINCFNNSHNGVVYSRAKYINENNIELKFDNKSTYLQPRRGKVTEWLLYDNFVPFSSSLVMRECFNKYGMFDESLAMGIDWDLWLRISTGYEFEFVDECLLYYRIGHSGQMSRNVAERHKCSNKIMAKFLKNFSADVSGINFKKISAYSYCNRGSEIRNINKIKSSLMYIKAIFQYPLWLPAYKGILKNVISMK